MSDKTKYGVGMLREVHEEIDLLKCALKASEARVRDLEAKSGTIESEDLKIICTDFYRWWHNQPGTNTDQGFDEWLKIVYPELRKALEGEQP
jgi:hypothetical protein